MRYYENVLGLIGDTPLVKLNSVTQGLRPTILAKLEYLNPGGSVKDRIGIAMLDAAERDGLIKPGGTIVAPTSGNTGVGLALVASQRGYKLVLTMPDKTSPDKEALLRAYGAEVILTPTAVSPDNPRSYYKVAERIVEETENAFSPNQYFNQQNPNAHYATTGPEIWTDTGGKVTHFVAGMGTGGTITGVARYLKKRNLKIQIVGADPEGSIYAARFRGEKGEARTYETEGIGEDFIPKTIDLALVDDVVTVGDKDAFAMARRLVRDEGMFVGESSGTAVVAALKTAEQLDESALVVVLLPDTGRNYLSTAFNDDWMRRNDLL